MKLLPSDPDIQTIISRIKNEDYDLQPDFQRGEVWGDVKKRRLIDSILRDWHVPPIHVVEVKKTAKLEVLDGQQRLAAIRDFVDGLILIDGTIQPIQDEIMKLDGMSYSQLPKLWRRRFDQFTIRLFKITDYSPEEPGELFYRLNQPTNLTSAEQRNAFFGPPRQQIKEIVEYMASISLNKETLGFSNSRMAYDDVISKFCYTLDKGSLLEKITSSVITNKYRAGESFSEESLNLAYNTLKLLGDSSKYFTHKVKFNKATLHSWLCFLARDNNNLEFNPKKMGEFISKFEWIRAGNKGMDLFNSFDYNEIKLDDFDIHLVNLFNDRASSRAANVTSVLIRDIVIWTLYYKYFSSDLLSYNNIEEINKIKRLFPNSNWGGTESEAEKIIDDFLYYSNWGANL